MRAKAKALPVGLRERNKIAKLRRIKAAARELFVSRGFDDTTTREIACNAPISGRSPLSHMIFFAVSLRPFLRAPIEQTRAPDSTTGCSRQAKYCPPLAESVEPVIRPASSEAKNTTQRAISSGSPRRPIGIRGKILFSSTSFGTACTISVLI